MERHAEDATLFERGGTAGAGQTGEEYRQTLRKELERNRDRLVRMPFGIGSGMVKGDRRGVFFCASIGERSYLRLCLPRLNGSASSLMRRSSARSAHACA